MYKNATFVTKFRFALCAVCFAFWIAKFYMYHWGHKISSANSVKYFDEVNSLSESSWNARDLMSIRVVRPHPSLNCTPLAMNNFPSDVFTQSQRRHGAVVIHLFFAVYMLFALAILCDSYFIPCLERICEVVNMQSDVAGATLMAAGSSAPELATTLVGVFVAKDDIGLSAVVGSADFNIMLVVSVTALFAKQVVYLNWWPLVRDSGVYLLSIILLALVIYDELIFWYESLLFLISYGFYVLLMFYNPRIDAFLRLWCRQNPTFCPRVLHSGDEERDSLQQHSGAFGHTALENFRGEANSSLDVESDTKLKTNTTTYHRLESDKNEDLLETGDLGYHKQPVPIEAETIESEVHITQPDESWMDICFSELKLSRQEGIRGKIVYGYNVFVWPIRLVLCLTIPDVRKTKWKYVPASHWLSFVMCCFWIGLFTIIMMWMITIVGVTLHIPDTIMGLTFIAAGSSVPDAIASVLVVREGEGDMAISNAIGSNVFDILVCMGLPWFLKSVFTQSPVVIYSKGLLYATLTLFTTVVFLLGLTHFNRWRLTKLYGFILLLGYVIVLLFCSLYELNYFGDAHLPECPLFEN